MAPLMHSWYYEKKDLKRTPSIVGGLDVERENRYRREGARFIINVGTKMGLRYDTMATGVVYFHRFYMFHSFQTFPRYVTACCCLFLAGKVEETPKKCKDIIRTAKSFLAEAQFAQFGDDPKEEVMTLERILLQTIKFDLQVDHPYSHLLKYAKSLKGDKTKLHNMVQMAWTFINDSLCTTLCLQWEPEVIAIALMYLAGKLSKFEVVDWNGRLPRHNHWWDMFVEGMSVELLEDICHQVLDLYSMPVPSTPQDSPPATPPTKSTRRISQPPSPVETSTSPAQIIKPKDPPVGQPIPRLEPGELKRKTSQNEVKELVSETVKVSRITEGKAIPTISSHSPKAGPSSLGSDTQPSSPSSPSQDNIKILKDSSRAISEPIFKSGLASSSQSTFMQNPPFSHPDNTAAKLTQHIPQTSVTSFSVSVPPPTATYTQTGPPFFSDNQSFLNMQQPPPQLFQRPPVQFQHPPPGPPSGPPPPPPPPGLHPPPPPHQYPPNLPPSGVPPFNSQFPPPRPPPSLIPNPPPTPVPGMAQHPPPPPSHSQGVPPVPGLIRNVPPPPGVHPIHHMVSENMYRTSSDMYPPDQRNRPPKDRMSQNQDYIPRPRFEGNFRGRRDSDYDPPFPRDGSYRRPPPPPNTFNQEFQRPPHPSRRFPLDNQQQRKHERGPHPSNVNNQQQHGGPTGIPPVRITGRY